MPNFENSISVSAPMRTVIDYVSNDENMPDYLPTMIEASMEREDRVHMKVEVDGEHHEDSGYFRVANEGRLEWGSEDHDYNGSMDFTEEGDQTNVTMQLHINPAPQK